MSVAESIAAIQERIVRAAKEAGRQPTEVTLLAVCKRQPLERILAAHDCGVRDFGENTVQGLKTTSEALRAEGREVRWHFVGGLQRNKVNAVLAQSPVIHSIDRASLAEAISKRAAGPIDVLVQVNLGHEAQKGGVQPEAAVELGCHLSTLTNLRLRGLMTLPPAGEDPVPHFETLRRLSEALQATPEGRSAGELSMGMSDDFETAIRCGATIVRVGTAMFGQRESKKGAT